MPDFVPCVMVGSEIRKERAPVFIVPRRGQPGGTLSLYDGKIEIGQNQARAHTRAWQAASTFRWHRD